MVQIPKQHKLKVVDVIYESPEDGDTQILVAIAEEGVVGTKDLYLPLAPVSPHKLAALLNQLRDREFASDRDPLNFDAREPTASYEIVTPYDAIHALTRNKGNRTLRLERIEANAHAMQSNLWEPTNQGLGFDTNGNLFDGQHRSWGIIFADVPVKMLVGRGLNPSAKTKVDTGAVRGMACILELDPGNINLKELPSPKLMNAILFRIFMLVGGGFKNIWNSSDENLKSMIRKYRTSLKWLHSSGYCSTRSGVTRDFTKAPILAGLILFHHKFKEQAEEFAAMVFDPEKVKSPAARGLYDYLIAGSNSKQAMIKTDSVLEQTYRTLRVAKYHMEGAEKFDHHCMMLPKTSEGMEKLLAHFSPSGNPKKLLPESIDLESFAELTQRD